MEMEATYTVKIIQITRIDRKLAFFIPKNFFESGFFANKGEASGVTFLGKVGRFDVSGHISKGVQESGEGHRLFFTGEKLSPVCPASVSSGLRYGLTFSLSGSDICLVVTGVVQ